MYCKLGTETYQRLFLELRGCTIKDKDRFDAVEEKLADSVEQDLKVGIGQAVAMDTKNSLIQPDAYIFTRKS